MPSTLEPCHPCVRSTAIGESSGGGNGDPKRRNVRYKCGCYYVWCDVRYLTYVRQGKAGRARSQVVGPDGVSFGRAPNRGPPAVLFGRGCTSLLALQGKCRYMYMGKEVGLTWSLLAGFGFGFGVRMYRLQVPRKPRCDRSLVSSCCPFFGPRQGMHDAGTFFSPFLELFFFFFRGDL
ncbi:hypothetical protein F4819DRAFT_224003 [Hypoxylon fuscum]|nr:hypothetical protein F4819DRAFT_224003 [Hypoxylon fuscum]